MHADVRRKSVSRSFHRVTSEAEILEKTALYFDAGGKEVWHCAAGGEMTFLAVGANKPLGRSALCRDFPEKVTLC